MYEQTINEILKKDKITSKSFLGVYARNEIPNIINYPACFIFNTKKRTESGEHWLAMYFDEKKKCFFFDSFGLSPHFYKIVSYIHTYSNSYTYNMKRIQGESEYCGLYCILFLIFITRNKLKDFFLQFNTNLFKNDLFIFNQIKLN